MNAIDYHKGELDIAKNKDDVSHINPIFNDSDNIILDIGCGIGQTFIAMEPVDKMCVGIDIDEESIRYGIEHYGHDIQFIYSNAKKIPMPSNVFDLVYSRVALPYTNIPKTIKEIKRVLKSGGRIWFTLHTKETALENLSTAIKKKSLKETIQTFYVLMNGYALKYLSLNLPFINGQYESWQDEESIEKLLTKHGFNVDVFMSGIHLVAEGNLK